MAWLPGLALPLYGSAITVLMYLCTDFTSHALNSALFPVACLLGVTTVALDYFSSPTLGENLSILERHGYPR